MAAMIDAMANPTIGHWQLAYELRKLRGSRTLETVGRGIEVAPTSVGRWEDPTRTLPRLRDLKALLAYYEVSSEQVERLLGLYTQAKKRGWWQSYGVGKRYGTYIGLEAAATRLEFFESELIPGLFQTEEYARAVFDKSAHSRSPDEVDGLIRARLDRQSLWRERAPETWAIVAESSLRHHIGGAPGMKRQLKHLIELSEEPNIEFLIIPFSSGGHAALERGSFVLLHLEHITVVYTEGVANNLFEDRPEDIEDHRKMMDRLRADALSPDQSRQIIRAVAQEM
ncbi:DUF5753 domain-containing protein [Nocardiopsis gilva]